MLVWGIAAPTHTDNLHVEIGGQNTLLKPFPQVSAALSSSFPLKTLERACGASFLTNLTLSEFPLSLYLNHLTHCALPVSSASRQAVLPFHVFFLAQPLGLAVCSTSFKAKVRYHFFRDIFLVLWFTAGPLCVCAPLEAHSELNFANSRRVKMGPIIFIVCVPRCSVVAAPPDFSAHGLSQVKILEWAAISSSRGSFPTQELNLRPLHWQADSSPLSHLENPSYSPLYL